MPILTYSSRLQIFTSENKSCFKEGDYSGLALRMQICAGAGAGAGAVE